MFSFQREIIITSFFRKPTKVSTNNFKIDIDGISDLLEMCKIITVFLHKSLVINQLEYLSHVVKEEVEALHRSYPDIFVRM